MSDEKPEKKPIEEIQELLKVQEPKSFVFPPLERTRTSNLDDDLGILSSKSKARIYRSTAQSIPDSTETKIQFNVENYDINNEFDNVTNYRFTAKTNGYYLIVIQSGIQNATADKIVLVYIYKNGVSYTANQVTTNAISVPRIFLVDVIPLNIGDYIEGYIYHNFGSNQNSSTGSTSNFLSIHKLS